MTQQEAEMAARKMRLAEALPDILPEIDGMDRSTLIKAFEEVRSGTLTPDKAMGYLMELYAYNRLRTRLNTRVA